MFTMNTGNSNNNEGRGMDVGVGVGLGGEEEAVESDIGNGDKEAEMTEGRRIIQEPWTNPGSTLYNQSSPRTTPIPIAMAIPFSPLNLTRRSRSPSPSPSYREKSSSSSSYPNFSILNSIPRSPSPSPSPSSTSGSFKDRLRNLGRKGSGGFRRERERGLVMNSGMGMGMGPGMASTSSSTSTPSGISPESNKFSTCDMNTTTMIPAAVGISIDDPAADASNLSSSAGATTTTGTSFPFADYPLEPSSPTSIIKRRRWIRPSERVALAVGLNDPPSSGTGSLPGGSCGTAGGYFRSRMGMGMGGGGRPLRPCLVSKRFTAVTGDAGAGSEASKAGDTGYGGDVLCSDGRVPTSRGGSDPYEASMRSGRPMGMETSASGKKMQDVWTPILPSPPTEQDGFSFGSLGMGATKSTSATAFSEKGAGVAASEHHNVSTGLTDDDDNDDAGIDTDESGEVEEYMLTGLYGSRGAIKVDELAMASPSAMEDEEGLKRALIWDASMSSALERTTSERTLINGDLPLSTSQISTTSTIMPSQQSHPGSSFESSKPDHPTNDSARLAIITTATRATENSQLSPPGAAGAEHEYDCEYQYLLAISAFHAAAASKVKAKLKARMVNTSTGTASSSSDGDGEGRSRSSTVVSSSANGGMSGSEADGEWGSGSGSGSDGGRRRRKVVHFPLAPERLGEIALCVSASVLWFGAGP